MFGRFTTLDFLEIRIGILCSFQDGAGREEGEP